MLRVFSSQSGQGTVDEARKRNFRDELEVREQNYKKTKKGHEKSRFYLNIFIIKSI
jgi:hypothetical protein